MLGVRYVDDRAVGFERRVAERLLGRAHRLERDAGVASDAHPVVARETSERFRHLRVVVREDDDVLRVGRDAVGVVADAVDVPPEREGVTVGTGEREARVRHPLLDPPVVGAAEEALRRAPVVDPGAVAGRVVVLGALPLRRGETECRLQQRGLDVLSTAGALSREERGVDADGGKERGGHARPRRVGEDRSRAGRAGFHAVGDLQVRQVRLVAVHVRHRSPEMTALLVEQTEAGGHQGVPAGAVAVRRVRAVPGDGAVHQPRVGGEQGGGVDAESTRGARRERFQDHIGVGGEGEERGPLPRVLQVELGAAPTADPGVVPGAATERVAPRRFHLDDVGPVVGEQHARHRPGDPRREVQDLDTFEHTRHPSLSLVSSDHSAVRTAPVRLAVTRTAWASGTWFTAVPRSWRVASSTRFSPWM